MWECYILLYTSNTYPLFWWEGLVYWHVIVIVAGVSGLLLGVSGLLLGVSALLTGDSGLLLGVSGLLTGDSGLPTGVSGLLTGDLDLLIRVASVFAESGDVISAGLPKLLTLAWHDSVVSWTLTFKTFKLEIHSSKSTQSSTSLS